MKGCRSEQPRWRPAARRWSVGVVCAVCVWPALGHTQQVGVDAVRGTAPTIRYESSIGLDAVQQRLEAVDEAQLAGVATFLGLSPSTPGGPITVRLAAEDSDWAAEVTPWTAGLALGRSGLIVLFPERAPVYPDGSLEDVLRHEITHVLIARAAGREDVPRWFHEGLAMLAERPWHLGDDARVVYELAWSAPLPLARIDRLFDADRRSQARAYALAGAFTRDLLARHGASAPRDILGRLARGASFEDAFRQTTGVGTRQATVDFWNRQRVWTTWVPYATSTSALWMGVTVLALYAIRRNRQKRQALREHWVRLEAEADGLDTSPASEVRDRSEPGARARKLPPGWQIH